MRLSENNKYSILLFLIVSLGLFLRLYHLGAPSLWYDELHTAGRINMPFIQTVKNLFISPFPPLYYIMMNLWVKVFGNSEFSLRFPSLIFSVLSIIFIFKLSQELFNKKVGLISALLLSISPYSINYAQEAKMYAMLWCLGILSFLFFYRFSKSNSFKSLLWYVIVTTLSVYTLYVGFIFILAQNLLAFVFLAKPKQYKRWLLGQLLIILLYLPWIDKFLFNAVRRTGTHEIIHISNYFLRLGELFYGVSGLSIGHETPLLYLELFLYGFLFVSAIAYFSKNDFLLFSWIIIPVIIYALIDIFFFHIFIRYAGFIHIPLIILFSKGINKFNPKLKSIILCFLLPIIFSSHLYPYYKYNLKIQNEDWRALFKRLNEEAGANDLIITNLKKHQDYYCQNKGEVRWGSSKTEPFRGNINQKYDSIFLIYRLNVSSLEPPEGYRLKEDYNLGKIGFLWFRRQDTF